MKRQPSSVINETSKPKMRQTTLVPTENLSQSINEELWENTASLLVYTHPKCEPSSKILGLDMDGTIIVPSSGKVFPKDYTDWKLINDNIIPKLKEYFGKGYKIVLLSNQGGITKGYQDIPSFKLKIQNIVDKLNIPIQGFFSILNDKNRKPLTGMWDFLNDKGNAGIPIDLSASLYSGDAAGRPASGKRKKDHSCADRLDNVGTWQKCVQAVEQAISKSLPVVVDNTNMDLESRTRYIKIAKVWDIPVKCFIMETSMEHAQHNERFRALTNSSHKQISQMVYNMMKSKYEKPTMEEGYQEIITIPFILDKNMENLSLYCKYLLEKMFTEMESNGYKYWSYENSHSFSIDQPLASSTQQPNSDVIMNYSINNNSTIPNKFNNDNLEYFYETKEWYLKYFSRYCEKDEKQCQQPNFNQTTHEQNDHKINKTKYQQNEIMEVEQPKEQLPSQQQQQQQQNMWETWTEECDIKLKIRLAGFGHLCILRGKMILESYFLILSKKWMKAVIVGKFIFFSEKRSGDEVMIQIRQSNRIKRFRMQFFNETDANDLFMNLSKFAATNTTTTTTATTTTNNTTTTTNNNNNTSVNSNELVKKKGNISTESILNKMLNNPVQLPESWSTEWPTQSLEGLIRLCLIDPNFPGFVNRIDGIMKKFTCTLNDLSSQ
ncbi:polynucleotide kinase-3'-phosphatase, putative [Schistosoma mansoni]|uniref:polynucleotide kinase-3'-phosphatase, putative n=1 Tax=Schistosoma mansoni TaxID=6183 RepID=UPI00022C85EF|nr:polynucleotide kinase-3'-phosphatase, putative [Schistosoma mansoni]|eukprot:XP_018644374.1 polynucleotide kinase-3'-phosphatase, putative [Schistosoma mansoni]